MDQGTETDDSLLAAASLWLVVGRGAYSDSFELDGERRRAVVVGACIDADVRILSDGAAPVECFFVREADEIRLVPASAKSNVCVGPVNVLQPMRLWRRTVVVVAGTALDVRVRQEPPTAPDNEVPLPLAEASVAASAKGAVELWPAHAARQPNLEQWSAIGSDAGHGQRRDADALRWSATSEGHAARRVESTDRGVPSGPVSRFAESPPSSTAPAIVSVRVLSRAPVVGLELLGLLTQRRPMLVTLSSAVGALGLAWALHWGVIALGVEQHPPQAAPLAPIPRFCGPSELECKDAPASRRAACDCLPSASPTIKEPWIRTALELGATEASENPSRGVAAPIYVIPVSRGQ